MQLFYGPAACSMGIHILLEEIGQPYEAVRVNTRNGETRSAEFRAVNPKAKVPALRLDDGFLLTEYPAIARHLATAYPSAGLLPQGERAQLIAGMTTDYCCATLHMQGFTRQSRPENFTPHEADYDAVRARGREIAASGFAIVAETLGDGDWLAGTFSYADTALFFLEFWQVTRYTEPLPPTLGAHYRRMLARPAVQRMLEQEGLSA